MPGGVPTANLADQARWLIRRFIVAAAKFKSLCLHEEGRHFRNCGGADQEGSFARKEPTDWTVNTLNKPRTDRIYSR